MVDGAGTMVDGDGTMVVGGGTMVVAWEGGVPIHNLSVALGLQSNHKRSEPLL